MESPRVEVQTRVWKLAGLFFCLKLTNNLGLVLLTTLFLKNYGAVGLPKVYILSNLLLISSQVLLLKFSRRKGFSLLRPLFVCLMVFLLFTAFLEFVDQPVLFLGALLIFMLYDVHATQGFADLTSQMLPLREAKEFLPTIYAAGSGGSIFSGLGIKFLMEYLRISQVFLFMILVSGFMLLHLRSMKGLLAPSEQNSEGPPETNDAEPLGVETRFFSRLLILFSFSAMLTRILSEFAYTTGVSQQAGSEKSLASFLGIFGAAIDVVVIGLQSFVSGRIFSQVKLGWIMLFRALGMATLTGIAWVATSIYSILGVQFFLAVMTKGFAIPAYMLLLEPIPRWHRSALRKYVSIGDSSAYVLGGVLLMILVGLGGPPSQAINLPLVFFGLMLLNMAQAALATFLDRSYAGTVRETIDTLENQGDLEILRTVRYIPYSERIARLSALLRDRDEEIRYRAILEAAELDPHDVADLILTSMVTETSSRNLARATMILLEKLGEDGVEVLEDFLVNEKDPRLVADIIEALGNTSEKGLMVRALERFLDHDNHRVKGTAILVLLKAAMEPGILGRTLDGLHALIVSLDPLERSTAAVVMGGTGAHMFVPSLIHLARDASPEVTKNAFSSLARLRTQMSLEFISHATLEEGRIGEVARETWKTLSSDSFHNISRLLSSLTTQERRDLGQWLGKVSPDRSFGLARKVVRLENNAVRETIIRTIGSMGEEELRMLDRCLVETPSGGMEIQLGEVLADLARITEDRLPGWVEIIPMVGGVGHPEFLRFLKKTLMECWCQGLMVLRSRSQSLLETADIRQIQEKKRKDRFQVAFHLIALGHEQPARILEAISKACATDVFVRSLALEFLEGVVVKELWVLLQPLLLFETDEAFLVREGSRICGQNPLEMNDIIMRSYLIGACA